MTSKQIEMAQRDPKTGKITMGVEEVEIVRVSIRNRDRRSGGHILTDIIAGEVKFKPGEIKTLQISELLAKRIKRREEAAWELTTAAPTPALADDDDEEAPEPTSSEASMIAAAEEAELLDEPPRVQRVQRRTKR